MKIKRVIFDLDGTLVNTIGGIGYNVNRVLEQHGLPTHPIEAYKEMVGYGLNNTMYQALPETMKATLTKDSEEVALYVRELVDFYEQHYLEEIHLYEGIEEVIDYLENHGISYGVHTNKKRKIAQKIGDHFFKGSHYLGLVGPDEEVPLKPDPYGTHLLMDGVDPSEVIYVGDTEVDGMTAVNAGVKSVLITWGFRSAEVLEEHADCLIDSPSELLDYIKST